MSVEEVGIWMNRFDAEIMDGFFCARDDDFPPGICVTLQLQKVRYPDELNMWVGIGK